jgi:hypothetical protein
MANWFFVWSPNIEIGVSDQQLGSPKKKVVKSEDLLGL